MSARTPFSTRGGLPTRGGLSARRRLTTRGAVSTRAVAGVIVFAAILAAVVAIALHDPTGERGNRLGQDFTYETKALRPIAPALIQYVEREAIDPRMTVPCAVAVGPEDRILVAGDRAVGVFTAQGAVVRAVALDGEPSCLAVTAEGAWYAGMGNHVETFDRDGARVSRWPPSSEESFITGIAPIPEGVAVADAGERVVRLHRSDGALLRTIGRRDTEGKTPGFIVPSPFFDVAMGRDNLLRITNPGRHKVEAYELDGNLCLAWGEPKATVEGFCGCCNPAHIAMLPDGGIVTSEKALVTVKIYEPDGALRCVVAGPEQLGEHPFGFDVAVDSRGRILVVDPAARRVRVFERSASPKAGTVHDR